MNTSSLFLAIIIVLFSHQAWAQTGIVKVGIFTSDPERVDSEAKVMDYLSKRVGTRFVATPIIGYERSVEKLTKGDIDAAVFGSAPAFISIKNGVAEPVARPEIRKSTVYYGYWMTLKDSGLKKIEDFKGKRFAYVDPYTSAGYLFPRASITIKGFDPDKFFGIVKFSKTHEAAIQMLLNGTVDGCAAKDTAYKTFIDTNIDLKDRINIIEVSGPFPERTLMISKKIDERTRIKVKEVLLNMKNDPEGKQILSELGWEGYVETGLEDFAAIERILKILKVENIQ